VRRRGPLASLLADRRVAEHPRGARPERLTGRELEGYLQQVTAAVVDALAPERVVLFGSFARGDQNRHGQP